MRAGPVSDWPGFPSYHGYAPPAQPLATFSPPLSIALARQTGARGRAVAKSVAELLGWAFYSPETVELLAHDTHARVGADPLEESAQAWIDTQLERLVADTPVASFPELRNLVRAILEIGAAGHAVLLGKAAGTILPRSSTLHARLIAPLDERVAYIGQWERHSLADAEAYVREREGARREFLVHRFACDPEEIAQYDLVLNTTKLGVDECADLIAAAARRRDEACADRDEPV